MKKWIAIILLLIIVGLVFIIIGCYKEPSEAEENITIQETEEAPEEEAPPEIPVYTEPEPEEQAEVQEPVIVSREEAPSELLTELRCVDDKIEGVVTNVADETMDLNDAIIYINGMLRRNPECDTMVLEPGESTFCTNLKGFASLKEKGNKLIFRISGLQAVEIINCE